MAQCSICQRRAPDISGELGVCLAFIRNQPEVAVARARSASQEPRRFRSEWVEEGLTSLEGGEPPPARFVMIDGAPLSHRLILLLGLGYRVFSVEATQLPYLWQTTAGTHTGEARMLAEQVCQAHSSAAVRELLGQHAGPLQA